MFVPSTHLLFASKFNLEKFLLGSCWHRSSSGSGKSSNTCTKTYEVGLALGVGMFATFNIRDPSCWGGKTMGKHHVFFWQALPICRFFGGTDNWFWQSSDKHEKTPGRMVIHHHWMACRFLSDKVTDLYIYIYISMQYNMNMYITVIHAFCNPSQVPLSNLIKPT